MKSCFGLPGSARHLFALFAGRPAIGCHSKLFSQFNEPFI
jgi:hypothetical protein